MRFLAATNNRGKLREIREILEEYGHECLSMAEAGIHSDPGEIQAVEIFPVRKRKSLSHGLPNMLQSG